jgi:hypothetical protein
MVAKVNYMAVSKCDLIHSLMNFFCSPIEPVVGRGRSLAGIRVGGGASIPISGVGLCGNFQAQSVVDCGKPLSAPAIVDAAGVNFLISLL